VKQMQEMSADGVIVGLHIDAHAALGVVIPVAQHRAQGCQQPVGQIARAFSGMIVRFRHATTERRHAGSQYVHGMAGGRQLFQDGSYGGRQQAQCFQFGFVGRELLFVRQRLVHQQVRYFLKLALRGDIEDVVAAVVQIVAGSANRAQRGIARGNAG
jgi:hypothetical protein